MTARLCQARYVDNLGAISATCILDADRVAVRGGRRVVVAHAGPHWGPIDRHPDKYQEWPK